MKSFFSLLLMLTMVMGAAAQTADRQHHQRPSFEQFLQEKQQFILTEMKLTEAEAQQFLPLYLELQKEKGQLMRNNEDARAVGRKVRRGEPVTDEDYTKAAVASVQLQVSDAQLQLKYIEKFQAVLTPQQLYFYLQAENKFKTQYMRKPERK